MLETTKMILQQCGLVSAGFKVSADGDVTGGCPKGEESDALCADYLVQRVLQRTQTPNMRARRR